MIAYLLKCVSDFIADGVFFARKNNDFNNINIIIILILIFPVWNKILKIWDILLELMQVEVKCSKNNFKFFLTQEAGASVNNKEKEKPYPKLKIYTF